MEVPRSVVVTGASRGIGLRIVRALDARGFQVFAGVRDEKSTDLLRAEGSSRIVPVILDVTDEVSVARSAEQVATALGNTALAGVVNNAGVFVMGPVEQTPIEAMRSLLDVNVLGPVRVAQAYLPLLRRKNGRLINISSVNGLLSVPYAGIYSASKFALEALSDALRIELARWHIQVVVVEPGAFSSTIRASGLEAWCDWHARLSVEERDLYDPVFAHLKELINAFDARAPSPEPVAEAVLEALTSDNPKARYPVGDDTREFLPLMRLPEEERDSALRRVFEPRR